MMKDSPPPPPGAPLRGKPPSTHAKATPMPKHELMTASLSTVVAIEEARVAPDTRAEPRAAVPRSPSRRLSWRRPTNGAVRECAKHVQAYTREVSALVTAGSYSLAGRGWHKYQEGRRHEYGKNKDGRSMYKCK